MRTIHVTFGDGSTVSYTEAQLLAVVEAQRRARQSPGDTPSTDKRAALLDELLHPGRWLDRFAS